MEQNVLRSRDLDVLERIIFYFKRLVMPYGDFPPMVAAPTVAQALVAANPERIVWGSDWPHPNSSSGRDKTEVTPPLPIDDGLVLNQLAKWVPDAATRKKILVDNPARLYS